MFGPIGLTPLTMRQVGAGIQIPPNSGRLLHRWGVFEHLQKHVVAPQSIHLRRWENGKIIGCTDLGDQFKSDFEVPYYVVHRAHLHEALHVRATELGVVIELSSKVAKYDERGGSVELVDGSVVRGDLIVAADGKDSKVPTIPDRLILPKGSSPQLERPFSRVLTMSQLSPDSPRIELLWT